MSKYLKLLLIVAVMFSCSCASQREIIYLQDNILNSEVQTISNGEIRFKPNDIITIYVSSRKPELASVFNISGFVSSSTSNGQTVGYTLDNEGNIDFPVLGSIRAEGFTKIELAQDIKRRILESQMIDDPTVTVEYQNLTFSTLGEVNRPGSYSIIKEKTTIFEALSQSGDLSISGLRGRVFLMRRIENAMVTYQVDLRSKDIYHSPAFYVQQNDVIYVEPNKIKTNQSTINGNSFMSASFWMTLVSFITSMTLIFVK